MISSFRITEHLVRESKFRPLVKRSLVECVDDEDTFGNHAMLLIIRADPFFKLSAILLGSALRFSFDFHYSDLVCVLDYQVVPARRRFLHFKAQLSEHPGNNYLKSFTGSCEEKLVVL